MSLAVKLIGLGGVGGIVARYLAVYLAALETDTRLVLVDGDDFEPGNAKRMLFKRHGNKATVVFEDLAPHVRGSRLFLSAVEEYVTEQNLPRLVTEGDVVLLAVDNHATRRLVNDHCAGLSDVCLISGGNDGIENGQRGTYGNVQRYERRGGKDHTPSLVRFHPEIAAPKDAAPGEEGCAEQILSTPQLLFTNLATASALLNAFWLHVQDASHYGELCFDIQDGLMRPVYYEAR